MSDPFLDLVASIKMDLAQIDRDLDRRYSELVDLVNAWRKTLENAVLTTAIDWPSFNRTISSMEEFEITIKETLAK
jgi:hypothetical protein